MRAERLFRALGLVDPALVEEALETRRRAASWRRRGALAACLALAIGFGWLAAGGFGGYGGGMPGGSSSGSSGGDSAVSGDPAGPGELPAPGGYGSAGAEEGVSFLHYEGPVLPLTTAEDPAGLTAERTVAWDFGLEGLQNDWPWKQGAAVTDAYVLHNSTGEDVTVTALYPFAGSFYDLGMAADLPEVTVDGEAAEAALYPGPGSGGYQSASGLNVPYYTADLERLDSWEEYRIMLESGQYLEWALGEAPALDLPVTVYEFSEFAAPHEEYPAAAQAISFRIDPEKTRVFTYGINGMARDGDSLRYDYFVPDGVRHMPELKLLVVLGEDIGAYTLQGYQDGGCEPGEELEGVSCAVTRSETTLDAVLDRLCAYYYEHGEGYAGGWEMQGNESFGVVPLELYRRAAGELLYQYSLYPGAPVDRFMDGRLDDVLDAAMTADRVLYLRFPVTVPAGGSVNVRCALWKTPSFDYGCSETENAGLQGYDLATRLGSGLAFTAQRAVLEHAENVEAAQQNFGFDLENGITAVDLDLEQEYYYMAIRVKGPRG